MDYKKTNAPATTVTRDMMELCADTGNVYETVAIIGKRANQISVEIKNDLSKKLAEFASYNDNLEEVFENREQIEISRYYEKLPKPDLIATQEYVGLRAAGGEKDALRLRAHGLGDILPGRAQQPGRLDAEAVDSARVSPAGGQRIVHGRNGLGAGPGRGGVVKIDHVASSRNIWQ